MTTDTLHAPPRRSMLMGLLRLRCPRCRKGRLFRSTFEMNDPCSVCGLMLQREPGYFLGAMYFAYFLAVALVVPLFLAVLLLFPSWHILLQAAVAIVLYLPLTPLVFRYSRALWLYWDRWSSPDDVSTPEGWAAFRRQETHDRPT
jgi:uncharacterized protein (DUF983 family)